MPRARYPDIRRDVAIKLLHASLLEDDEYRVRFLREARSAGDLSHPNLVLVHNVAEIDGQPYMALELTNGALRSDEMTDGKLMPLCDGPS